MTHQLPIDHHRVRSFDDAPHHVTLLRWPHQATERYRYLSARRPVLWVVESDASPPGCIDHLEDWVRPPLGREDIEARGEVLSRRARFERIPVVEPGNVLCSRGTRLPMSESEGTIMTLLVRNFQEVVTRQTLIEHGWSRTTTGNRNALDLRMLRLRRRIEPLDLVIVTVWGRGYMLESAG